MGDIKNPKTQFTFVDTDLVSKIWIGGGMSDAASIVGAEFADITGGTHIDNGELDDILSAALTSRGWSDVPGLDGVEIVSLTSESFTIAIDGSGGSKDYYTFTGDAAATAIASISGGHIDIKNSKSQVAIFDTDAVSSIWIGGGKSDARNLVGEEFAEITGGSRIHDHEVEGLLAAATSGSSWTNPDAHGLGGVELLTLTDDEFTLTIDAAGPTRDTIIFKGADAADAIVSVADEHIDIKNNKTQVGYFDVTRADSTFFLGGGASDKSIVSDEFNDLVAGSQLNKSEVLSIFEAITSGGSWGNPGSNGLDRVELVGMDNDSFTIALDTGGPAVDYIIFDNVHTLDGATAYGFAADDLAIV
ncbi:hypothetical protein R5H30_03960 [Sulfitobacter sp. D35]|uniref:hypothetical protein n=1 Tax=Sulfitobacter sp. D35 TaxID=3083252 RepID=UPI00296F0127|nr:hypothetical protein [Sulfitobacter sp. D35]MDW4497125.1 hypothetical protein [Sulfitobacter sp. D35]